MNILDPLIKPFSQTRDPYRGMDPETRAFLQTLADADSTPMEKLSPIEARHVLEQAQQETMVDISGIDTRQLTIDCEGHVIELDSGAREFLSMPWEGLDEAGQPRRYFIWGATAAMLRNLYRFLMA